MGIHFKKYYQHYYNDFITSFIFLVFPNNCWWLPPTNELTAVPKSCCIKRHTGRWTLTKAASCTQVMQKRAFVRIYGCILGWFSYVMWFYIHYIQNSIKRPCSAVVITSFIHEKLTYLTGNTVILNRFISPTCKEKKKVINTNENDDIVSEKQ